MLGGSVSVAGIREVRCLLAISGITMGVVRRGNLAGCAELWLAANPGRRVGGNLQSFRSAGFWGVVAVGECSQCSGVFSAITGGGEDCQGGKVGLDTQGRGDVWKDSVLHPASRNRHRIWEMCLDVRSIPQRRQVTNSCETKEVMPRSAPQCWWLALEKYGVAFLRHFLRQFDSLLCQ